MCGTVHATGTQGSLQTAPQRDISAVGFPEPIAKSKICKAVWALATQSLDESILNHSVRVFLHAYRFQQNELAQQSTSDGVSTEELLFAAALLHDLGTSPHHDGPERFEVEGADAASALLKGQGVAAAQAHDVWVAIALHTSPGIAERIGELARAVRYGVLTDFSNVLHGGETSENEATRPQREEVQKSWPRLGIEVKLGDAVVSQAMRQPSKAPPATWVGVLYRSALEDPGYTGVNKLF